MPLLPPEGSPTGRQPVNVAEWPASPKLTDRMILAPPRGGARRRFRMKIIVREGRPAVVMISAIQGQTEIHRPTEHVALTAGHYARLDPDHTRTDADDEDGSMAYGMSSDKVHSFVFILQTPELKRLFISRTELRVGRQNRPSPGATITPPWGARSLFPYCDPGEGLCGY
jgi:hypothetical protein